MRGVSRQRQPVELILDVPSVAEAVATAREYRKPEDRRAGLLLKVYDDGRISARQPPGRYSVPPALDGRFEADGGLVVLRGVIREALNDVFIPRLFLTAAAVMIVLGILLIATGKPVPLSPICFVAAVYFSLVGYGLGRLLGKTFPSECEGLIKYVTSALPVERSYRLP
jgi:hypothetical protein